MTSIPQRDPQELLQHEPFVRELARLLVGDRQHAEDLAQDAWVAALEAGPAAMHSQRGWLATVLQRLAGKQRRAAARRRRREDFVAGQRPDRAPSVDELLEREHARAAVVRAVLALPDAYRDVIVLRWFEGLPPRDVAQRLGVPVETVRTRHRRAFDRLREELDAQHGGDRAAWFATLTPLADASRDAGAATTAVTTTLLGGLLMLSMKTKLLTVAAAVVVIGLGTWAMSPAMTAPSPVAGGNTVVAATADALDQREQIGGEHTTTQRAAVADTAPITAPATTGTAVINVTWHDGTPAQDVQVMIRGSSETRSAVTDQAGTVRFADFAPGACWANIERGSITGDDLQQLHFEIFADRETEVAITVAEALLVTGIVVDGRDEPVAGTRILVTPTGSTSPVAIATTGEDGRFSARDVACWCKIHALADGLAPSLEREVTGSRGGSIELRFVLDGPCGNVVGTALGPDRQPVAKTRVWLRDTGGPEVHLPDGTKGRRPGYAPCTTDERGRFSFSPVAPGELLLSGTASGLAQWQRKITVTAGRVTEVEIELLAGVTVHGAARDPQGNPVSEVIIGLFGAGEFRRYSRTDSGGLYEITNVPPGPLRLTAGTSGQVATSIQTRPGESARWDPVLPRTATLRGRIVDHEGQPVPRCSIKAHHYANGSGTWYSFRTSDAEGRFRLDNCEAMVPMHLRVTLPESTVEVVHLTGIEPGDEELLVTLPRPTTVHLRGIIVDEQDQPLSNVQVFVFDREQRLVLEQNRADGTFEFGPFPAGDYYLHLFRDQSKMRVPFHTIADGETWDLGRLQMPRGGSVRTTLIGEGARSVCSLEVTYPDGEYAWSDLCRDGTAVIGPLAPGDYLLHVRGADICNQVLPVTIRNGRDTVLDVPVRQGTPVTLRFEGAEGTPTPLELHLTITDATTGARHLDTSIWDRQGLTLGTMLPPGRYRIEASGDNKMQQTLGCAFEFDVGTEAIERTVQLTPR